MKNHTLVMRGEAPRWVGAHTRPIQSTHPAESDTDFTQARTFFFRLLRSNFKTEKNKKRSFLSLGAGNNIILSLKTASLC